jgi:hypothetical protein
VIHHQNALLGHLPFSLPGDIVKKCKYCERANPVEANFCMHCGMPLQTVLREPEPAPGGAGRYGMLSLGASLLLSLVLMKVTGMPILLVAGFLPLFWFGRKS